MKQIYIIFLVIIFFSLPSCAKKQLYNWRHYSDTLYAYKKTPDDKNIHKHKQELLEIIEKSEAKGRKVPPGIYCEYGYILMNEGNTKEALKYYDMEEQTYPESQVLIQMLKSKINTETEE